VQEGQFRGVVVEEAPVDPAASPCRRGRCAIRDTVVDAIAATGQIEAHPVDRAAARGLGTLTDILVREGQEVGDGTALFKVDDAELKAQVAQPSGGQLARQALERTKQLIAQNASSTSDLEQSEAKSRGADANYDLLKTRLDRTVVRAPSARGRPPAREHRDVRVAADAADHAAVGESAVRLVRRARALRRPAAPRQLVSFQVAALPGKNFSARFVS